MNGTIMLTSIAKFGDLSESKSDITSFLTPVRATNVLAIQFRAREGSLEYETIEFEQVKEARRYLYCKDLSGKPGLFLSWRISTGDVKSLKNALAQPRSKVSQEALEKLENNKVKWLSGPKNGGFQSKLKILRDFPAAQQNALLSKILETYAKNIDRICKDFEKTIVESIENPTELLLTIKIIEGGNERYPGDYDDFVRLFRDYVVGTRG